jgi:hypothetical protein
VIFTWDGETAIVKLAPDEQRSLKLLSERMYLDDGETFVMFASFRWNADGAEIFRTLKSLGMKLHEEPEEPVWQRRRNDPPNLVRELPRLRIRKPQ